MHEVSPSDQSIASGALAQAWPRLQPVLDEVARGSRTSSPGLAPEKAFFWQRFAKEALNERQIKVLNRLRDGFQSKLTSSTWAKLAKCPQDTAHRDILPSHIGCPHTLNH